MARTRDFRKELIKSLRDPEEAIGYFNAILEECKDCDEEEAQKLILLALKNIAEAQGGITELAKRTGLGRESLYKTLSAKGNPKLSTLISVTQALMQRK
jgi:probable addiction module antidote protein